MCIIVAFDSWYGATHNTWYAYSWCKRVQGNYENKDIFLEPHFQPFNVIPVNTGICSSQSMTCNGIIGFNNSTVKVCDPETHFFPPFFAWLSSHMLCVLPNLFNEWKWAAPLLFYYDHLINFGLSGLFILAQGCTHPLWIKLTFRCPALPGILSSVIIYSSWTGPKQVIKQRKTSFATGLVPSTNSQTHTDSLGLLSQHLSCLNATAPCHSAGPVASMWTYAHVWLLAANAGQTFCPDLWAIPFFCGCKTRLRKKDQHWSLAGSGLNYPLEALTLGWTW